MAIALENSINDNFSANGATSLTVAMTTTGSNTFMFVNVYCDGVSSVSGVTYAGVSMTRIGSPVLVDSPNDAYISLYYLIAPTTGSNNIVVSTGAHSGRIRIVASQFSGCKQSAQPDASTTNTNTSSASIATTLTTVADNCFVYIASGVETNGNWSAGTGSAVIGTPGTAPEAQFQYASNPATPAGNVSMTINNDTATRLGVIMVSIAPPASAGVTLATKKTLLSVGL